MAYKVVDLRGVIPGDPVAVQGAKPKSKGVIVHYNGDPNGFTGVVGGRRTPGEVDAADARYHLVKNFETAADPDYSPELKSYLDELGGGPAPLRGRRLRQRKGGACHAMRITGTPYGWWADVTVLDEHPRNPDSSSPTTTPGAWAYILTAGLASSCRQRRQVVARTRSQ